MAAGAVLACAAWPIASAGLAQPAASPRPDAPTLTKDEVAALSDVGVSVKKSAPTAVSGLTVTVRRSTTVSELAVVAPLCPPAKETPDPNAKPPKLVNSYPSYGSTVRRGILILRLTFDRPMTCEGLLDRHGSFLNPCPAPLISPMVTRDHRTFVTVCILDPPPRGPSSPDPRFTDDASVNGLASYNPVFGLDIDHFTSLSGRPLSRTDLMFDVDPNSRPVETVREAMTQDRFMRDAVKAAEQAQ